MQETVETSLYLRAWLICYQRKYRLQTQGQGARHKLPESRPRLRHDEGQDGEELLHHPGLQAALPRQQHLGQVVWAEHREEGLDGLLDKLKCDI